jgi:hypothetical protein
MPHGGGGFHGARGNHAQQHFAHHPMRHGVGVRRGWGGARGWGFSRPWFGFWGPRHALYRPWGWPFRWGWWSPWHPAYYSGGTAFPFCYCMFLLVLIGLLVLVSAMYAVGTWYFSGLFGLVVAIVVVLLLVVCCCAAAVHQDDPAANHQQQQQQQQSALQQTTIQPPQMQIQVVPIDIQSQMMPNPSIGNGLVTTSMPVSMMSMPQQQQFQQQQRLGYAAVYSAQPQMYPAPPQVYYVPYSNLGPVNVSYSNTGPSGMK